MQLNERIKQIRIKLGLSQDEFGRRLGVTRGAITNIELNKVDPKPLFVDLICREFGVNEIWLRTGEGEMFDPVTPDEELADFFGNILAGEPDFKRRFIYALSRLSSEQWEMLEKVATQLVADMQKESDDQI